jgi:hypothetical protein
VLEPVALDDVVAVVGEPVLAVDVLVDLTNPVDGG